MVDNILLPQGEMVIKMAKQPAAIEYEDFDRGIRASHLLGVLEGRADMQTQMQDMQKQLKNMLTTNRNLHRLLQEEYKSLIRISPRFARGILDTLKKVNCSQYEQLRRKYEAVTGEDYKRTRRRRKKI